MRLQLSTMIPKVPAWVTLSKRDILHWGWRRKIVMCPSQSQSIQTNSTPHLPVGAYPAGDRAPTQVGWHIWWLRDRCNFTRGSCPNPSQFCFWAKQHKKQLEENIKKVMNIILKMTHFTWVKTNKNSFECHRIHFPLNGTHWFSHSPKAIVNNISSSQPLSIYSVLSISC